MIGTCRSSSISMTKKKPIINIKCFTFIVTFTTFHNTFILEPSMNCRVMLVGFRLRRPIFSKKEWGIRLQLAPKSCSTWLIERFPNVMGMVKHSLSFKFLVGLTQCSTSHVSFSIGGSFFFLCSISMYFSNLVVLSLSPYLWMLSLLKSNNGGLS